MVSLDFVRSWRENWIVLLYGCGQRDGDDYMRLIPKYCLVDEEW